MNSIFSQIKKIILLSFVSSSMAYAGCIEDVPENYDYMGVYGNTNHKLTFISDKETFECSYLQSYIEVPFGKTDKYGDRSTKKVNYICKDNMYLGLSDPRLKLKSGNGYPLKITLISNGEYYKAGAIPTTCRPGNVFINGWNIACDWLSYERICNENNMTENFQASYKL